MAKPKTIPAIEPNAGLQATLQKKIVKLVRDRTRAAAAEIFDDLINSGLVGDDSTLAQDADITIKGRTFIVKNLKALNPEKALRRADSTLAERLARWMIHSGDDAKEVSNWFVRAAAQNVTASQRRALIRAGISPKLIKSKWTIPVVKNRYISPEAAKEMPKLIDDMTGLITKMQADDLARLRGALEAGLSGGRSLGDIEAVLRKSDGFTEARAKRVALDQSVKANQALQRANAQSLGAKTAIWVHVPGQYSSRPTHVAMDGKRFKLDEGIYDSEVGKKVVPGELPYCRCIFRIDIDDLLK